MADEQDQAEITLDDAYTDAKPEEKAEEPEKVEATEEQTEETPEETAEAETEGAEETPEESTSDSESKDESWTLKAVLDERDKRQKAVERAEKLHERCEWVARDLIDALEQEGLKEVLCNHATHANHGRGEELEVHLYL